MARPFLCAVSLGVMLACSAGQKPAPVPDASVSGASRGCTEVPVLLDGEDLGWRVGVGLTAYNGWATIPEFGPDKEAEFTVTGSTITVQFHPRTPYVSDQGPAFDNKYWLYVGVMSPFVVSNGLCHLRGVKPGDRVWNLDLTGRGFTELHLRGRLRVHHDVGVDQYWAARALLAGGVYGFYPPDKSVERIVAFNDTGYDTAALAATTRYDCRGHWNNLYWGSWWRDQLYVSPSGWGPWTDVDVDLEAAARRARELAAACGQPLPTGHTVLYTAHLGPEDFVGATVTFEVADLRLESVR